MQLPSVASLNQASPGQRSFSFSPGHGFFDAPGLPLIEIPTRRPSLTHTPRFLGFKTDYRPAWLLGASNVGATVFGFGEVLLQRTIWPASAYEGLARKGATLIPAGDPGMNIITGTQAGDIALGTVLMAAGVSASVASAVMFLQDAQALARHINPNSPNLTRARLYFSMHLFGLFCLVCNRFAVEAFREYLAVEFSWLAILPAAAGVAIFAVTQAQSFSNSELYNGSIPVRHRGMMNQAARAGVASWIVLGTLAGTPNMSSYLRELVRLFAVTSTGIAYSLALTESRIMEREQPSQPIIGPPRFRGDFTAMQSFGLYTAARICSAISASLFEMAMWPSVRPDRAPDQGAPAPPIGSQASWRGLPPPLPSSKPIAAAVPEAVALMGLSLGLALYAFYQMRKDALARGRLYANSMAGAAFFCMVLGQTYRVITEHSKAHADFRELWIGMPIGFVANAIAYVTIPELFSQSEISQGNRPISYRYQVMEACRFSGAFLWALWVGLAQIQFVPPLLRQAVVNGASLFTLLAMALPDATTRGRIAGLQTPRPT